MNIVFKKKAVNFCGGHKSKTTKDLKYVTTAVSDPSLVGNQKINAIQVAIDAVSQALLQLLYNEASHTGKIGGEEQDSWNDSLLTKVLELNQIKNGLLERWSQLFSVSYDKFVKQNGTGLFSRPKKGFNLILGFPGTGKSTLQQRNEPYLIDIDDLRNGESNRETDEKLSVESMAAIRQGFCVASFIHPGKLTLDVTKEASAVVILPSSPANAIGRYVARGDASKGYKDESTVKRWMQDGRDIAKQCKLRVITLQPDQGLSDILEYSKSNNSFVLKGQN